MEFFGSPDRWAFDGKSVIQYHPKSNEVFVKDADLRSFGRVFDPQQMLYYGGRSLGEYIAALAKIKDECQVELRRGEETLHIPRSALLDLIAALRRHVEEDAPR